MAESVETKFAEPNIRYCGSAVAVGKWIIICLTGVVLGLVLAEHGDPTMSTLVIRGEEYTVIICVITLVLCFAYLIVYACGCQKGWCRDCKCHCQVLLFYILGSMMWFAAGGVETYATTYFLDQGQFYLYRRRAAAASFCYLNAIIFGAMGLRNLSVAFSKESLNW